MEKILKISSYRVKQEDSKFHHGECPQVMQLDISRQE